MLHFFGKIRALEGCLPKNSRNAAIFRQPLSKTSSIAVLANDRPSEQDLAAHNGQRPSWTIYEIIGNSYPCSRKNDRG